MERTWFALGAVMALLAVAAGAFATHGLKDRISADHLDTFQTAARYHMYHALALLAVAYATYRFGEGGLTTTAGWLFVAGIVFFSGSLYLLALTGVKILGAIAPIGGVCLIGGWACLAVAAWRS